MSHHRLISGGEVYCRGTHKQCSDAMSMHVDSRNGAKPTKASTMTYTIETVEGDYPLTVSLGNLGYRCGRVPAGGELR